MTVTIEKLQSENRELRAALEKVTSDLHYARVDGGSFTHRGLFYNCPAEDCVYARILLGKELPHHDNEH